MRPAASRSKPVTWHSGRISAPAATASGSQVTSAEPLAPVAQPAWQNPQAWQAGRKWVPSVA